MIWLTVSRVHDISRMGDHDISRMGDHYMIHILTLFWPGNRSTTLHTRVALS